MMNGHWNFHTLLVEMQNGTGIRKIVLQFHIKFNICLQNDPAISLLGIYQRRTKTYIHANKDLLSNVNGIFIHNICLKLKTTQISIKGCMSQRRITRNWLMQLWGLATGLKPAGQVIR